MVQDLVNGAKSGVWCKGLVNGAGSKYMEATPLQGRGRQQGQGQFLSLCSPDSGPDSGLQARRPPASYPLKTEGSEP